MCIGGPSRCAGAVPQSANTASPLRVCLRISRTSPVCLFFSRNAVGFARFVVTLTPGHQCHPPAPTRTANREPRTANPHRNPGGGVLFLVACSNAYARRSSVGSLHAEPVKPTPYGCGFVSNPGGNGAGGVDGVAAGGVGVTPGVVVPAGAAVGGVVDGGAASPPRPPASPPRPPRPPPKPSGPGVFGIMPNGTSTVG